MALDENDLVRLFRALASAEESDRPARIPDAGEGDPLDVVRRIEVGEDLQEPRVRAALAEVADALAHGDPRATLSPRVREAVLAAQRLPVGETPRVAAPTARDVEEARPPAHASEPLPATRRVSPLLRVAALVVLSLGVGLLLASRREAGASLRVAGVDRLAWDGSRREVSSSRTLPAGTALAGEDGEFLVVTLQSGGRLLLGPGDEVAIVGVPRGTDEHDARLALVAGRARLEATPRGGGGRGGIEIDVGNARLLTLATGRAVLVRSSDGVVVVPDAAATFRVGTDTAIRRGPTPLFVPFRGNVADHVGDLDTHDLFEAFDRLAPGPAAGPLDGGWRVAPRRWRVVSGAFERPGRTLRLSPSAPSAVIAWAPFASLGAAEILVLDVEGGPAFVRPRIDGAETFPVRPQDGVTYVRLPPAWLDTLAGGELELEFTWPAAPSPDVPHLPLRLRDATFARGVSSLASHVPTSAPLGESDEVR